MSGDLHEALRAACADVGIVYKAVPADGRFHETDVEDDPRGRGDGRIKLFPDGEGGIVCNWKGETRPFFADDGRKLPEAERRERDRKRQEAIQRTSDEEARRCAEGAKKAAGIWTAATPARADHPYLLRKHVPPVATLREIDAGAAAAILGYLPKSKGEPLAGRVLVAPVKVGDKVSTAELIDEAGHKSAIYGGAKAGGYWAAQPLPEGDDAGLTFQYGEGVATSLSAKEANGKVSIAALSASNLPAVMKYFHQRYPAAVHIALADLVKATGEPDPHAIEAARSVGGLLAIPDFGTERQESQTDFNDLHQAQGLEAVARAIANASAPAMAGCQPDAGNAAAGDPGGWPEPQPLTVKVEPEPYPLDALPDTIRAAVEEVQGFTKAPIPMVASSALAALSLAIQSHADVKRADKLTGPASLFLLTIADSGERKSTCDGFFTAAIREYQAQQAEAAKPEQAKHRAALAAWEAKRAGLVEAIKQGAKNGKATGDKERDLHEHEQDKPKTLRVPKLLRGDDTPENLAWVLSREWPSAGAISAEAGVIFGAHGMGKDSIMRNLALLNILWDGGRLEVGRRSSESFTVEGARLTVALQIQEMTLRSFFEQSKGLARGTGFLARFLVAWPESTQGFRLFTKAPANWPHLAAFNRRIAAILDQSVPIDDDGALTPPMLPLTAEAKAAWIEYHNAIEGELASGGELYDVRDVASKSADNAARLAALFQIFEGAGGAIGAGAFEGASRIAAWHLNESRRFFGELALPVELANAARLDTWLIEYCRRERTHLVGKNHTRQHGPLRDGAALDAAIRELEDLDRVRPAKDGKRRTIKVNPALLPQVAT